MESDLVTVMLLEIAKRIQWARTTLPLPLTTLVTNPRFYE